MLEITRYDISLHEQSRDPQIETSEADSRAYRMMMIIIRRRRMKMIIITIIIVIVLMILVVIVEIMIIVNCNKINSNSNSKSGLVRAQEVLLLQPLLLAGLEPSVKLC